MALPSHRSLPVGLSIMRLVYALKSGLGSGEDMHESLNVY